MQADAAIIEDIRERIYPHSRLEGPANVLVMPDLDAADIAYNMIKVLGDAQPVGPILMGTAKPAHILGPDGDGTRHRQSDRRGGGVEAQGEA